MAHIEIVVKISSAATARRISSNKTLSLSALQRSCPREVGRRRSSIIVASNAFGSIWCDKMSNLAINFSGSSVATRVNSGPAVLLQISFHSSLCVFAWSAPWSKERRRTHLDIIQKLACRTRLLLRLGSPNSLYICLIPIISYGTCLRVDSDRRSFFLCVMYIYGCINPPPMENGYNGTLLDREDMERASVELVGKPILMEHLGPPIGKVDAVWRRPADDRLMMVGHTNETGVHADFARSMLKDKSWAELSLSTTVPVDMNSLKAGRKTFNEISVVKKGARVGTTIELCELQTSPGKYKSDRVTHNVIKCSANSAAMATPQVVESNSAEGAGTQTFFDFRSIKRLTFFVAQPHRLQSCFENSPKPRINYAHSRQIVLSARQPPLRQLPERQLPLPRVPARPRLPRYQLHKMQSVEKQTKKLRCEIFKHRSCKRHT